MIHAAHPFPPFYSPTSNLLILGTFPSPKSIENGFYYGHPQNRFWKILATILDQPLPNNFEEKKALLDENGIALWDVLAACEIQGASDQSIKNPIANPINELLIKTKILAIFTTGKRAFQLFNQFFAPLQTILLPSPSPANCAMKFEEICEAWRVILPCLEKRKGSSHGKNN